MRASPSVVPDNQGVVLAVLQGCWGQYGHGLPSAPLVGHFRNELADTFGYLAKVLRDALAHTVFAGCGIALAEPLFPRQCAVDGIFQRRETFSCLYGIARIEQKAIPKPPGRAIATPTLAAASALQRLTGSPLHSPRVGLTRQQGQGQLQVLPKVVLEVAERI